MADRQKLPALARTFVSAMLAGIMIGIGGMAFLSCPDRTVGALLFCVGLFTICTFGLRLYTGRVGHVLDNREFADLGATWLGNLGGTLLAGLAIAAAKPALSEAAYAACAARLTQSAGQTLVLSLLCGILMYVAVDSYRKGEGMARYLGILLCVPTFILCGCEHSVADMFYFALAGAEFAAQGAWPGLAQGAWPGLAQGAWFIVLASLGNAAGALLANAVVRYITPRQ